MLQQSIDINLPGYTLKAQWLRSALYREEPVLIFLHDSLGCIALWRDFPEQIASGVQMNAFIYERRGYGHSSPMTTAKRPIDYLEQEADTLLAVMDQAGIREAVLWGFSDGGSIALLAAAKFPERIKGIIVQGAHVIVEDITLAGIAAAVQLYRNGNLKEKLMRYHGENTDRLFAAWTDTWLLEAFRHWSMTDQLAGIHCPVMVIQGEQDEFGTDQQVKLIKDHVTGYSETHLLPGAGHTTHRDLPKMVTTLSIAFLQAHILA